jgi:pimeloyl-ACP methyl ester carboxylesterase
MNQTRIITTDLFPRLAYRRLGEGPALLLLHGFPASGKLWNSVTDRLSRHYTLLIPDIPGSGESRLGQPLPSIEDLATLVPAVLDDAGLQSCVLAGHSMGGYIALAAAEAIPERLDGLFLVHSTALPDDEAKKEKRIKSIALIRNGGREEFIRGMVPALFSESFREGQPEAVAHWRQEGMKLAADSMVAFYSAMMNRPDRTQVLTELRCPVGWALGKEDSAIPWESCLQQSILSDVTFIRLYEHCGHMGMIEQAEALAVQLERFCDFCNRRSTKLSL